MKKVLFFFVLILFFSSCQIGVKSNMYLDLKTINPVENQAFDVITNHKYIGSTDLYTNCKEESYTTFSKNDFPIPVNTCNCTTNAGIYKMYEGVIVIDNNDIKDFVEVTIFTKDSLDNQQDFVLCHVTYNFQTTRKGESKRPVLIAGN